MLNCPRPEVLIGSVSSPSLLYFPALSHILLLIFCVFIIGEKLKISVGNQTTGLLKLPTLSFCYICDRMSPTKNGVKLRKRDLADTI